MANLVKGLFGGGAQDRLLKKQQADLKATEEGQRRLRQGGRGLLSFIEDDLGGALGGGQGGLLSFLGGG